MARLLAKSRAPDDALGGSIKQAPGHFTRLQSQITLQSPAARRGPGTFYARCQFEPQDIDRHTNDTQKLAPWRLHDHALAAVGRVLRLGSHSVAQNHKCDIKRLKVQAESASRRPAGPEMDCQCGGVRLDGKQFLLRSMFRQKCSHGRRRFVRVFSGGVLSADAGTPETYNNRNSRQHRILTS